ncbi:MAG: protein kinase [Myxococcales bacterium]|nr:protein kinase [Myxococcales bacterium]
MPVVRLPSRVLPLDQRRLHLGAHVGRGFRTEAYRGELEGRLGVRHPVLVKLFDTAASDAEGAEGDSFVTALVRAAARAARVQHPNVARVYDCGEAAGRAFLVTEEVPGVSLHHLLRTLEEHDSRLGFDVALFISCEVADALAGALAAPGRVCHGDLSPRQVMLGWTGVVKVTDFEIGRVTIAQSGVRSLRTQSSRLENLAPELVQGSPTTPRSDVFALGMLLRQLFVGRRFKRGLSHAEVLHMVTEGQVDSPSFRARIPRELSELILTATAVSPDERFPSARAVAEELRVIAFRHGVGDARPFLARALDRALPDEAPAPAGDDLGDDSFAGEDRDALLSETREALDLDSRDWREEDDEHEHEHEPSRYDDEPPWSEPAPPARSADLGVATGSGPRSRAANAWRGDDDDDDLASTSIHRSHPSADVLGGDDDDDDDDDLARTSLHAAPRRAVPSADAPDEELARTSVFHGRLRDDDDDLARTTARRFTDDERDDLSKTTVLRGAGAARARGAARPLEEDDDFDPEATVNLK